MPLKNVLLVSLDRTLDLCEEIRNLAAHLQSNERISSLIEEAITELKRYGSYLDLNAPNEICRKRLALAAYIPSIDIDYGAFKFELGRAMKEIEKARTEIADFMCSD